MALWEGASGRCPGNVGLGVTVGEWQSVALLKVKPWWPPSPLESRSVDRLESTCLLPPTLSFRT